MRASASLGGGPSQDRGRGVRTHAVEATVTGADGEDGATDYRLLEASLAVRSSYTVSPRASFLAIYGAGYHTVRVTGVEDEGAGPYLGAGFVWEASEAVHLYGRTTLLWSFDALSGQIEGGAAVRITDGVRALLGYRFWKFEHSEFLSGTDVDLEVHGFVVGLTLDF